MTCSPASTHLTPTHPGYGRCRAVESWPPPPSPTFPQPLEIPPPTTTLGITTPPTASAADKGEIHLRKEESQRHQPDRCATINPGLGVAS
jgi:hypothetical protein